MNQAVALPEVALPQRRQSDRAAAVFVAATLVGLLRLHPSFFPTVLSVYWADAALLGAGVLWMVYNGGLIITRMVTIAASLGLLFLVLVTTAILGSSTLGDTPLFWQENLIQAVRFFAYGCLWMFLADSAIRADRNWTELARPAILASVGANIAIALIQLTDFPGFAPLTHLLWGVDKLRPLGHTTPRVFGTFFNPNWFGVFAAWVATYAVATWRSPTEGLRARLVVLGAFFVVLASGSRTGLFTMLFGMGVTMMALLSHGLRGRLRVAPGRLLGLAVASGAAVVLLAVAVRRLPLGSLFRRFVELRALLEGGAGAEIVSFSVRLRTWERAFNIFLESPIFGVGGSTAIWRFNAHNGYLVMLMFFGILGAVGLTLFVLGLTTVAWRNLRGSPTDRRLRAWFIGFTAAFGLAMMVGDFIFASQLLFLWFVLLALVTGQSRFDVESQDEFRE